MNYLVTGGAGFIGSHVCERLIKNGHKVVCLDNFDDLYPKSIKIENVNALKENPRFQLITGDVCDIDNNIDLLESKKIETVIHIAGRSGTQKANKNPLDFINSNIKATVSILESMKEAEIKKIVYLSTSSVYGHSSKAPFEEHTILENPDSVHTASKQSAEKFLEMYNQIHDINTIILRVFSVFGPNQPPESGIYQFVKANLTNQSIALYGEGNIGRDYTYISDIVDGIILSCDYLNKNIIKKCEIFNLGSGQSDTIADILTEIEKITGTKTNTFAKPTPNKNTAPGFANIDKASKILKYNPQVPLSVGLKNTIEWIKSKENL